MSFKVKGLTQQRVYYKSADRLATNEETQKTKKIIKEFIQSKTFEKLAEQQVGSRQLQTGFEIYFSEEEGIKFKASSEKVHKLVPENPKEYKKCQDVCTAILFLLNEPPAHERPKKFSAYSDLDIHAQLQASQQAETIARKELERTHIALERELDISEKLLRRNAALQAGIRKTPDLEKTILEQKAIIATLSRENQEQKDALREAVREVQSQKESVRGLQDQLSELKQVKEENAELRKQLDESGKSKSELEDVRKQQQASQKKLDQLEDAVKSALGELGVKFTSEDPDLITALQDLAESKKSEHLKLQEEIKEVKAQLEEAKNTFSTQTKQLGEEKKSLQTRLDELESEQKRTETQAQEKDAELQRTQREHGELKSAKEALENQLESLQKSIANLTLSNQESSEKATELSESLAKTQEELEASKAENKKLERQKEEQEARLSSLGEQIETQAKTIEDQTQKVLDQSAKLLELKAQLEDYQSQIKQMTLDMNKLAKTENQPYDVAKTRLQDHIADIEARIGKLEEENQDLRDALKTKESLAQEQNERIRSLEHTIAKIETGSGKFEEETSSSSSRSESGKEEIRSAATLDVKALIDLTLASSKSKARLKEILTNNLPAYKTLYGMKSLTPPKGQTHRFINDFSRFVTIHSGTKKGAIEGEVKQSIKSLNKAKATIKQKLQYIQNHPTLSAEKKEKHLQTIITTLSSMFFAATKLIAAEKLMDYGEDISIPSIAYQIKQTNEELHTLFTELDRAAT